MPHPEALAARLRAAAEAGDLDALHGLVDWELTGVVAMLGALSDVAVEDRAEIAARGFEEIDSTARSVDAARPRLAEALRALASGDVAAGARAALALPPAPDGLADGQVARVEALRERAVGVRDAIVVARRDRADLELPVTADGQRVVLV